MPKKNLTGLVIIAGIALLSQIFGTAIDQYARTLNWNASLTMIYGLYAVRGVFESLTTLMLVLVFLTHPEFGSVITFEVRDLIVLQKTSGITLFHHSWNDKLKTDEYLLGGLMQALQAMSFQVVELGNMRDVEMENGFLLFHQGKYITVGLICKKNTFVLQQRLEVFVQEFETKYLPALDEENMNISIFDDTSNLVKEIFFTLL